MYYTSVLFACQVNERKNMAAFHIGWRSFNFFAAQHGMYYEGIFQLQVDLRSGCHDPELRTEQNLIELL